MIMDDPTFKVPFLTGQRDFWMYGFFPPAFGAMCVKTCRGADTEGTAPAITDQPITDVIIERKY